MTKTGGIVFVSVGASDGTPMIALPWDDEDGQRRYRVGTIQVAAGSVGQLVSPPPTVL